MKILKSIGAVFVRIWRWIKNTAWVQPLLIVGAIFGVIFSIPAITSAIQGAINNANSAENFLRGFKKSLEHGENSECDKLFINYNQYESEKKYEEIPANDYKYFIMFTKNGDNDIANVKTAFETLKNNWGPNSLYVPQDGKDFRLYTVFTDEVTAETTSKDSAFAQFLGRQNHFFEKACEVGLHSQYYINGKITKDQLEKMCDSDPATFITPTIVLVDWGAKSNKNARGISQIMYSIPGDNANARAKLLLDCWNGTGDFEPAK